MKTKLKIKGLDYPSYFKLVFIGIFCSLMPYGIICGILSLFGIGTVRLNDVPVTGFWGLPLAIGIGLFIALLTALVFSIFMGLGIWIYSRFQPIEINYSPAE